MVDSRRSFDSRIASLVNSTRSMTTVGFADVDQSLRSFSSYLTATADHNLKD